MKILALEHENGPVSSQDFQPHLKAEAARVWQLYQAGVFREVYFRQDQTTAVIVLECESVQAARDVLATLPLVQAGLLTFELIPLRPYPGFARLFTEQSP
jgi:hypothetical protein